MTAMQYIQLQMVGAARSWLKSRRRGIYDSWEQFSDDFIRSFRSTCRRPVTIGDLRACRQRPNEKLRRYIQSWTALKNNAENISDETAVDSFTNGLLRKDLVEYIGRVKVTTLSHLMEVANSWADGEELGEMSGLSGDWSSDVCSSDLSYCYWSSASRPETSDDVIKELLPAVVDASSSAF